MGKVPSNSRQRIHLDRAFQTRFALRLSVAFAISLVPYVGFALLAGYLPGTKDLPREVVEAEAARMRFLLGVILLPMLCTFGFLFYCGVRESFRIAGPSYRFRQVLESVRQLRIPRGVIVRKTDYLQDTAESMDQALIVLHDEFRRLRDSVQQASTRLAAVTAAPDSQVALAAAQHEMEQLRLALERVELVARAPTCDDAGPVEPAVLARSTDFDDHVDGDVDGDPAPVEDVEAEEEQEDLPVL